MPTLVDLLDPANSLPEEARRWLLSILVEVFQDAKGGAVLAPRIAFVLQFLLPFLSPTRCGDVSCAATASHCIELAFDESEATLAPPALFDMLKFVEYGDSEQLDDLKTLQAAKASIARALVSLSFGLDLQDLALARYWQILRRWLSGREDLVATALSCFGNAARQDSAAVALVSSHWSDIQPLLRINCPTQVQHALLGLLKNLSIPVANKALLGADGVIEGVCSMDPWADTMEMVGSVQGAALGVIKNLCRGDVSNCRRFLGTSAEEQILALVERTENPALRFEAIRIFVNISRTLGQPVWSPPVLAAFVRLLREGREFPVLVNEAIIALTLSATLSEQSDILRELGKISEVSGTSVLISTLVGGIRELQANAVALCRVLGQGSSKEADDFRKEVLAAVQGEERKDMMDLVRDWTEEG